MSNNRTTELLMREFVDVACECEVRDYLISEYAERIEQAIAATLGGGTLTAEQVREAIERHAIPSLGCRWQFINRSYEAIADELNARAERTCECVAEYAKSPFDGKTMVLHRCSKCHELMRPHMLYCPNCGARVVA